MPELTSTIPNRPLRRAEVTTELAAPADPRRRRLAAANRWAVTVAATAASTWALDAVAAAVGVVAGRLAPVRRSAAESRVRLPGRDATCCGRAGVARQPDGQLVPARGDGDEHQRPVEGGVRSRAVPVGQPAHGAGGVGGRLRRHRGRQGGAVLRRRVRDGAAQRRRRLDRRARVPRRRQRRCGRLRVWRRPADPHRSRRTIAAQVTDSIRRSSRPLRRTPRSTPTGCRRSTCPTTTGWWRPTSGRRSPSSSRRCGMPSATSRSCCSASDRPCTTCS